jgi:hypothetical protein
LKSTASSLLARTILQNTLLDMHTVKLLLISCHSSVSLVFWW